MPNSNLADDYDLSDVEPGVDKDAALSFLSEDKRKPKQAKRRKPSSDDSSNGEIAVPKPQLMIAETWTTRTVRLRQTTATALTKATYAQRTKQTSRRQTHGR